MSQIKKNIGNPGKTVVKAILRRKGFQCSFLIILHSCDICQVAMLKLVINAQ